MHRNEKGLSLIEVLVTLVILSIVGTIIWSVFNNGVRFSNEAISKNQMQQEANIVLTKLTKIHQTATEYTLMSNSNCTFTVKAIIDNNNEDYQFENSKLCLQVTHNGTSDSIDPVGKDHILPLIVTISDRNNLANDIELDAVLSRLKDF